MTAAQKQRVEKIRDRGGAEVKVVKNKKRTGFQKGQSGNPAGRPKGALNKGTKEFKGWLREVFESQDYRNMFLKKLKAGNLPPNIWQDALNRAYGKPATTIEAGKGLLELLLEQGEPQEAP